MASFSSNTLQNLSTKHKTKSHLPLSLFYHSSSRRSRLFFSPNVVLYVIILALVSLLQLRQVDALKLSSDKAQRFANQPSPQTAVIGSVVVLPCRVINKVGELQWTRDDFGLGNERELTAFKRYKMIGSHEEGEHKKNF